jgi:hypothetical protein
MWLKISSLIIVIFLLIVVPLGVDRLLKNYQFTNKYLNYFLIFNAIFSNSIAVTAGWFFVVNFTYDNPDYRIYLYDNVFIMSLFTITVISVTIVHFFIWSYFKRKKIRFQSILDFSKFYAFQVPFLFLLYFMFNIRLFSDEAVLFLPILYACAIVVFVYSFIKIKSKG